MAGLLAGPAPAADQSQIMVRERQSESPPATASPAEGTEADASEAAPDAPTPEIRRVFRGADGQPLPPDVQRQLEEHFRNNPLPTQPPGPSADNGEIVVTGERPRGSVVGDLPPERTFGPLDIRAFGAATIGELIEALGPQVRSDRGRDASGPVTLLNGRRISDFSEIARIPPEAIERMEVFPEELALQYGYAADQKVVNVVTRERFDSQVAQVNYLAATDGGRDAGGVNLDYLALRGDTRFGLGTAYNRSGALRESERDLADPAGFGQFRTLLPQSERLALNGVVSSPVLPDIVSTLNGRFETGGSESLLGPGPVGPLRRDIDTQTVHLGTTHNGRAGRWLWTLAGTYERNRNVILTDTVDGSSRDRASSVNSLAGADMVLNGPLLDLPAGPLSISARGGFATRDFDSRSRRGGVAEDIAFSRDRGAAQASLDLPLSRRGVAGPALLGNLSANANAAVEQLSDFGALHTLGYGLNWSPVEAVSLILSVTHEEAAPTMEQLGAPLLVTPNVRTFDFARGEIATVTRLSGGNPALRADDRTVTRLGLNARPLARTDFTISAEYLATRIDNPIAAFPIVTPQIEAAFPERFARDGDGRLLRIDGRPLNFVRADREQLRWGVNFTRPLGPVPPGLANARARVFSSEADVRRLFPNAQIVRAEAGSPLARRAENMASRLFFSLYHTWHFSDQIVLRESLPAVDLLDGGALDFRGGRRRHEIEFQAGAFKRGLGARLTASWQSGSEVRDPDGAATGLRFSSLASVNLNLFANLAERFGGVDAPAWLKGTRASLGVTNLFNTRPKVRDPSGATPLTYQPANLDPLGRLISFSLRKVF